MSAAAHQTLVLYTAPGCGLCDTARAELERLRDELGFELREVDISGDDELERRYRVLLPVVELDGEQLATYFVDAGELRERLLQARSS